MRAQLGRSNRAPVRACHEGPEQVKGCTDAGHRKTEVARTRPTFGAAPCVSRGRTPIAGEHRLRKGLKVVEPSRQIVEYMHAGGEGSKLGSCWTEHLRSMHCRRIRSEDERGRCLIIYILDHSIYLRLSPVPDPWVLTSTSPSAERASLQTLALF